MQRPCLWILAACLGVAALFAALPAGADPAPGKPAAGPFADVPTTHPAYAAVRHLETEFRIPTLFPANAFAGTQPLTRYEFGIAVQRMLVECQRTVVKLQSGEPKFRPTAPGISVRLTAEEVRALEVEHRRLEVWKDPRKRERGLAWFLALVTEFGVELKMLGSELQLTRGNLIRWQEDAREAAEQAEKE